jgi:hypothetical protein
MALQVKEIYVEEIGSEYPLLCDFPRIHISHSALFIDDIFMSRNGMTSLSNGMIEEISDCTGLNRGVPPEQDSLMLLRRQFPVLRSLARCVDMNYLAILVSFLVWCAVESCKCITSHALSSNEN